MTEAEWLGCADPLPMLGMLRGKVTDRKLRLYAVACCRVIWQLLEEDEQRIVEVAESFADNRADGAALLRARDQGYEYLCLSQGLCSIATAWLANVDQNQPLPDGAGDPVLYPTTIFDAVQVAVPQVLGAVHGEYFATHPWPTGETYFSLQPLINGEVVEQRKRLAGRIRDIFGNPFRVVSLTTDRLTSTVKGLATALYEDRAFDRLPLLADALEDAGCTDAAILDHCRQPGEHVRGCWVVDLILGKS